MADPLISCLCVTCPARANWLPWLHHQVEKQTILSELILISGDDSIGAKRQRAIRQAKGEYIAWFDDDDWSSHRRLSDGVKLLEANPWASCVGNWRSWMVSARDLARGDVLCRARAFQSHEGVIFNGAVYRRALVPKHFEDISQREDTFWQAELHNGSDGFLVYEQELMHFWLCHEQNVTNSDSVVDFNAMIAPVLTAEEIELVKGAVG